jgi:hypothetical protein
MTDVVVPSAKRPSVLPLFVAVLLIPAVLGSSSMIFNDGDVSWHIASGRWILAHRALPTVDPFSFTWAGKPWVAMEWLADAIYATAYDLRAYSGVAALVTAAIMALNAIVFSNANRWSRYALITVVAMDVVLIPMTFARPHVLVWPIVAFWTALLMRARGRDRAPPLWAALLMTLWGNLHASVVVGLFIAGVFGLEALVASTDRARAFREWLIFGLACAVAVCINGNGIHGVLYPLNYTDLKMLPLIDEWKPSSPRVTPFFFGALALTFGLIAWKQPRLHPVRWFLLGALLLAAMFQARHQAMLAIVASMVLPEGFAKHGRSEDRAIEPSLARVAGGAAALLVAVRALMPLNPPDNEANPWKLIAAVPPELRSQPVINGYSMGGPLILSGIRPYIDGRSDMYGDALVLGYRRITQGDANEFAAAVRRWNIRWAIVPNNGGLMALLDRSPGWRRIRRDKVGAIYVRETPDA